jgi:serine/threonine protein kinase
MQGRNEYSACHCVLCVFASLRCNGLEKTRRRVSTNARRLRIVISGALRRGQAMTEKLSVETIFGEAIAIASPEERAAYLDRACQDNPLLRQDAEKLVVDYFRAGNFMEKPLAGLSAPTLEPLSTDRPGAVIGPYKLKEQIGEGGMGLVFVAEQSQPVRRKVALKLIKPGMDTRQVIARFEAERQALALMNHPNIAKVHDGGETPSGRPYFVMELVKGVPITEYCDQNRLTTRARLELFGQVCAAVQHAHQKGIIHRDIKPTNVMVVSHDGTPVVKVIDFGVAKAIGQQLTDKSVYTQFSQFIGTPLYMSPEQAGQSGLDIDTRTDIYALGVLLYELLTGTTPFDKERLASASYDEIRRLIRDEEPPKPSTRMSTVGQAGSTISAQRQTNPQHLCLLLRGELDWIVMKALEKDRNRRYESGSALAADIERYLKDEPVQACPPSLRYLLGKFLRRHRTGVLTTAALLMMALLFGAGAGWITLDRAARRSNTEQAVEDDLKEAEKHQQNEQWANVGQALERANGRLASSGQNALQAKVDQRRRELDLITQLDEARMKAVALSTDFNRNDHFVASDRAYAAAFTALGLDVMALPAEEAARRIRACAIHSQLVSALDHWAYVKGRLPKANAEPLRTVAQLVDDNAWRHRLRDPKVANDRERLKHLAKEDGVLDQPPASLLILSSLLKAKDAPSDALQFLRRAQRRYPADFRINFDLGMMLRFYSPTNRKDGAREAVGYFRAALALQPQSPHVYLHLADAIGTQGLEHEAEAQETTRKAIALKPDYAEAYFFLGNGLWNEKKAPEAEWMFRKVIGLEPDNLRAYHNLVVVLRAQGKLSELVALKEQRLERLKDNPGSDHRVTLNFMNELACEYFDGGQQPKGIALFLQTLEKRKTSLGADHADTHQSALNLADAYGKLGDLKAAERVLRESLAIRQARAKEGAALSTEYTAYFLSSLGLNLLMQQEYEDAEPFLQECLAIRAEKIPDTWQRFHAMSMLGGALLGQKKYPEAEPLLLESYGEMKQREAQHATVPLTEDAAERMQLTKKAGERIVRLYEETNRPAKAIAWREKLSSMERLKEKDIP